jgi:hypothetical protein
MKIKKIFVNSMLLGKLPEGCKLCVRGAKLVLFVTGLCDQNCWYCTISRKRWQKDVVLANEVEVKNNEDILKEAKLTDALGAGITGGEPTLVLKRTVNYIKLLKQNFGKKFHLHLYTHGGLLDRSKLKFLYDAGLDEIRFHCFFDGRWKIIEKALNFDWDVGIEVPVIPEYEEKIREIIVNANSLGVKFINLDEFEFSERNEQALLTRGYEFRENAPTAVKGSEEIAKKLLKFAKKNVKKLSVHYCSAATKNVYQLKNRWKRRASNIKEPYELVNEDGLLVKGIIEAKQPHKLLQRLRQEFDIPKNMIKVKTKVVETSVNIIKTISKKTSLKCYIVKQLPIENGWYVEKIPLS